MSGSYGEELETGPAAWSGTAPVPHPTNGNVASSFAGNTTPTTSLASSNWPASLSSSDDFEIGSNHFHSRYRLSNGEPGQVPIVENTRLDPINPYGFSKLVCERMMDYFG